MCHGPVADCIQIDRSSFTHHRPSPIGPALFVGGGVARTISVIAHDGLAGECPVVVAAASAGAARSPPAVVIFIVSPFADRPGAKARRAMTVSALDTLNSMCSRQLPKSADKSTRQGIRP